jgi:hypothetical protein
MRFSIVRSGFLAIYNHRQLFFKEVEGVKDVEYEDDDSENSN